MHGQCLSASKIIGDIDTMTVSKDGKQFIGDKLSDSSQLGRLFDLNSGVLLREYIGHTDTITSIKFSTDGQYVLTGSTDTQAILWSQNTGQEIARQGGKSQVNDVEFSKCGQYVFIASQNGEVKMLHALTGQVINEQYGHQESVTSISVSEDGQSIATASLDTTVKLFDVMSRNMIKELRHLGRVHKVQFDKDSEYLLSTGDDGVYLWDIKHNYTQRKIGELKHGNIHEFKELINRSATFSECGELIILKSEYKNYNDNQILIQSKYTGLLFNSLNNLRGGYQSVVNKKRDFNPSKDFEPKRYKLSRSIEVNAKFRLSRTCEVN